MPVLRIANVLLFSYPARITNQSQYKNKMKSNKLIILFHFYRQILPCNFSVKFALKSFG